MKPTLSSAFCASSFSLLSAPAQAPQLNPDQASNRSRAFKEVQAQQAAMAENQAKIDEKLATLAETVRVARIYASRGGTIICELIALFIIGASMLACT